MWPIPQRNFRLLEGSYHPNNAYGGERNSFRISGDSGLTPRVPLISVTQRQMLFMGIKSFALDGISGWGLETPGA